MSLQILFEISINEFLIPHLLSLAITLAFILEFSYFYPSDGMEKFYDDHANEADVDKKFIDAYFK